MVMKRCGTRSVLSVPRTPAGDAGRLAGSLDDDPGTRIEQHIFVGSKAPWDEIPGGAPQYEEAAPARR
jgi:hypothetical protein